MRLRWLLCALLVGDIAAAQNVISTRVIGADVVNSSTTPTDITGLSWTGWANTPSAFVCTLMHLGTATSGPRFNIASATTPTHVNIRWMRGTTATAQAQSTNTGFSNAAQTAAITSSGNTTVLSTQVYGVVLFGTMADGVDFGTIRLQLTSSTAGQEVRVYRGSTCIISR